MNRYEEMSKTYRELAERGEISKEEAEKQCKVYNFLASCDSDDICNLFDSGAFDSFAIKYTILAVENLRYEKVINNDQAHAVFYELLNYYNEDFIDYQIFLERILQ